MVAKLLKIGIVVLALIVISCSNNPTEEEKTGASEADILEGEKLAKSYCGSCHQFVDPSVLDKATWVYGVLPAMGPRLGIYSHRGTAYPNDKNNPDLSDIFPEKPVMSAEDWQKVIDYFVATAPERNAPQQRETQYTPDLELFTAEPLSSNNVSPIISLIKIIKGGGFFIYDANSSILAKMNSTGTPISFSEIKNPVSWIEDYKSGYLVVSIGSIMPSDIWQGEISYVTQSGNAFVRQKLIRDKVERPVQIKLGDLNGDKVEDIVVCGYGHNKGDFYWLDGTTYEKRPIKNISGAISTQLIDFDKDGDLDIFTLFAQGTEQIVYFENNGKGVFKEKVIKEFLPVRGSTSFTVLDFNKDGNLDILYTCGDNADFSVVLKNFHGVYIYLGDGKGAFTQSYFYPMHGAFKAVASDFDKDGDLDIAAISFFADYVNQPYEGFLFFEQTKPMQFTVKTNPETYKGRWLTMDVGDINGDGDDDILLGNFSMGPTNAPDQIKDVWAKGPAAMVLLNRYASLKNVD